jgi:hypothetical protein
MTSVITESALMCRVGYAGTVPLPEGGFVPHNREGAAREGW